MITVYKNSVCRQIPEGKLNEYLSAGWSQQENKDEERLVLRPPVKSKGTVKLSLDNANKGE